MSSKSRPSENQELITLRPYIHLRKSTYAGLLAEMKTSVRKTEGEMIGYIVEQHYATKKED